MTYLEKLQKIAEAAEGLRVYLQEELDCKREGTCDGCYYCDFNKALDALKPTIHQIVKDNTDDDTYHVDLDLGHHRTWYRAQIIRDHITLFVPHEIRTAHKALLEPIRQTIKAWLEGKPVKFPMVLDMVELQDWWEWGGDTQETP